MLFLNRLTRLIQIGLFVLVLATSVSCTSGLGNMSLVSTKDIDLESKTLDLQKGKRVTGEDCNVALLGLIPLGVPSLEEAVEDALENGEGNVMADAYSSAFVVYTILFTYWCIEVRGTVLKVPEKAQGSS